MAGGAEQEGVWAPEAVQQSAPSRSYAWLRVLALTALLHADGWELLFYRSEPPRFGAPVRQYCMAVDRSTRCEHPLTLAARVVRNRMQVSGTGASLYGLVLGDAERVTVTQEGEAPVEAELAPRFVMELPPLTRVQLRDLTAASGRWRLTCRAR